MDLQEYNMEMAMKYTIESGKLKRCIPEIKDTVRTIDGIRVRTQSQELDLIIPEGVTSIDKKAFDLVCDYVEAVYFPTSLRSLEGVNFKSLRHLVKVAFNGFLEMLPHGCFSGLKELETVQFRNSVKAIGESAFSKCKALRSVELPEGLERIERYAFFGCHKMTEIDLPSSLKYVGSCAFCGTSIKEVVFKESEDLYLGSGAFHENSRLTKIVIPEGAKEINHLAFSTSAKHVDVFLPASLTNIITKDDSSTGIMGSRVYYGIKSKCYDNSLSASDPAHAKPAITIIAPAGSYAIRIAKKNSIPYKQV